MTGADDTEKGRTGDASPPGDRRSPAQERNAERFDRQARALRENLRRRNRQRRGNDGAAGSSEEDRN